MSSSRSRLGSSEKDSPDAIYRKKRTFTANIETAEWENRTMDELVRIPQGQRYLRKALRSALLKKLA
jgi:hypothetical protein